MRAACGWKGRLDGCAFEAIFHRFLRGRAEKPHPDDGGDAEQEGHGGSGLGGFRDAAIGDLRRTLAAYFEEGGSPHAAGRRLSVSRNTVTYRVRRAEELLGRPVTVRRQHLQAALHIVAWSLGEADEADWADRTIAAADLSGPPWRTDAAPR